MLKYYMNIMEIYNTFEMDCSVTKRRTQFCQCAPRAIMHSRVILVFFFGSNLLSSWF